MNDRSELLEALSQLATPLASLRASSPSGSRNHGGLSAEIARLNVTTGGSKSTTDWSMVNRPGATATNEILGTSPQPNIENIMTRNMNDFADQEDYRLSPASTTGHTQHRSTTLHEIMILPEDKYELDKLCFKHIGVGVTSCIRKNCTTNHRRWNGQKESFLGGTIVVAKDKSSIFNVPTLNTTGIASEVLTEWKTGPKYTLDKWKEIFQAAENGKETHGYVTASVLDSESTFQAYASRYKSPRLVPDDFSPGIKFPSFKSLTEKFVGQAKRKLDNEEGEFKLPSSKRFQSLDVDADEKLQSVLEDFEQDINEAKNVMIALTDKLDQKSEMVNDELKILLTRTQGIEGTVGQRIGEENNSFKAPTLWGSIALLSGAFDDLHNFVQALPENLEESKLDMNQRLEGIKDSLEDSMQEALKLVNVKLNTNLQVQADKIQDLSDSFLQVVRSVIDMRNEVSNLSNTAYTSPTTGDVSDAALEISELKEHIRDLSARLDLVIEDRATKPVKFFGITLRNSKESNVWAVENLDDDTLGVIVDVHLVFEHIFHQTFAGEGVLKTLQGLYKVKIDTITQGLACSSFDTRIPKFFHTGMGAAEVGKGKKSDPNKSALDGICSWDDWDLSTSGFRTLLESQLTEFKISHTMVLNESILPGTPSYNVAMLAIVACTSWISSLIAYIDRTNREFHFDGGFTTERSWHIVTHLVHRIFMELSEPRVGTSKMLKLVNNQKTTQLILWPLIQCHEVMKRFEKASFKDDPCIASEYVKFIMKNSASDTLTLKLNTLEGELKDAVKSAKVATTTATTASNVASEGKKSITDLIKRVDKMEKSSK